jgi:PAS domain S-box-containing protein
VFHGDSRAVRIGAVGDDRTLATLRDLRDATDRPLGIDPVPTAAVDDVPVDCLIVDGAAAGSTPDDGGPESATPDSGAEAVDDTGTEGVDPGAGPDARARADVDRPTEGLLGRIAAAATVPVVYLVPEGDPPPTTTDGVTPLDRSSLARRPSVAADQLASIADRGRSVDGYRSALERVAAPVSVHDPDTGTLTWANRSFRDLAGLDPDAFPVPLAGLCASDGRASGADGDGDPREPEDDGSASGPAAVRRAVAEAGRGDPTAREWAIDGADGTVWLETRFEAARVTGGAVVASSRDVTDRRAAAAKFERLLATTDAPVSVHDPETGALLDASESLATLLGRPDSEALVEAGVDALAATDPTGETGPRGDGAVAAANGDGDSDGATDRTDRSASDPSGRPSDRPALETVVSQVHDSLELRRVERATRRPDGQRVYLRGVLTPGTVGGDRIVIATWEDVTDERRLERQYQQIFNAVNDSIVVHDPETGAMVDANDTFCDLVGYDRERVLELGTAGLSVTEEGFTRDRAEEIIERTAREGGLGPFEWQVETADGDRRVLEVTTTSAEVGGRPRHLSLMRDVTERRQLEKTYREVFDRVAATITLHAPGDPILRDVNRTLCEMLGYDREELLGVESEVITADVDGYDDERIGAVHSRAVESDEPLVVDWPLETRDGTVKWVEATVTTATIEGEPRVISTGREITEAKRRRREYEQLFDGVNDAISVHDPATGEYLEVNDTLCEMLGYTREEIFELGIEGISVTEEGFTADRAREFIAGVMDSGESDTVEWKVETSDGDHRWLEVHGTPAEIGGERRFLSLDRDITEAKRRQREYEQIFNGVNDAIAVHDPETAEYLEVNDTLCDLLGYPREEVLEMGLSDIAVSEDGYTQARAREIVTGVAATGESETVEWKVETAAGDHRWLEVNVTTGEIGGETRVLSINRDVTERRRREREYEQIFNGVNDAIAVFDPETAEILDVNETYHEMLGYEDLATIRALGIEGLSVSDEGYTGERGRRLIGEVAETGEPRTVEWQGRTADGDRVWLESTLTPAVVGGDERVLSIQRDVTERKRREREYEQIFDGVIDAINLMDPDTLEIVDANQAYLDMLGYEDVSAVRDAGVEGISLAEEGFTAERSREIHQRVAESGEPELVEWQATTSDGERIWLEIKVAPAVINGESVNVAVHRDVTERKRRERAITALQTATEEMQTARTPTAVAETAVEAASDALGLEAAVCWTPVSPGQTAAVGDPDGREPPLGGDDGTADAVSHLDPVAATEAARETGLAEPLAPSDPAFDRFRDGEVGPYDPAGDRAGGPSAGLLLPLGEHGLLAVAGGEPVEADGVVRDVAEVLADHATTALDRVERVREVTESERRFRLIAERVDEVFYLATPDFSELLYVNPAYEEIWGQPVAELYEDPTTFVEAIDPRDRDGFEANFEAMLADVRRGDPDDSYEFEYRIRRSDGEVRWVHATGYTAGVGPTDDDGDGDEDGNGDVSGDTEGRFVGIVEDVTGRKRREQRLEVFNRVLRHNLRNRVDVIKSYAEALADRTDGEYADRIATAADDLAAIGDRARDVDRLMSRERDESTVDIGGLVAETLAVTDADARSVDVTVDVTGAGPLVTDREVLGAVLESAVENALDHADAAVSVTARGADQPGTDGCTIAVRDDGPGIPPAELASLEAGTETALQHGRGLGLWQLKWGVGKLNGDLSFETGDGTTVRISIPDLDGEGGS